jgi:hypothetical protein
MVVMAAKRLEGLRGVYAKWTILVDGKIVYGGAAVAPLRHEANEQCDAGKDRYVRGGESAGSGCSQNFHWDCRRLLFGADAEKEREGGGEII